MTTAKSTGLRYSLLTLCGAFVGALWQLARAARAQAMPHELPIPLNYFNELQTLAAFTQRLHGAMAMIVAVMVVMACCAWLLVAGQLNPALNIWKRPCPGDYRRNLLRLAISGALVIGVAAWSMAGLPVVSRSMLWLLALVIVVPGFGVAWLVAMPGGAGQVGEGPAAEGFRARLRIFLWGGTCGIFLALLSTALIGYAYAGYQHIVVEALGRGSEGSIHSLLRLILARALATAVLCLCAAMALPWFRPHRLSWRPLPPGGAAVKVLLAALAGIAAISMPSVSGLYDLDKPDLPAAAGLENFQAEPFTLVQFCGDGACRDARGDTVTDSLHVQAWPQAIAVTTRHIQTRIWVDEQIVPLLQEFILRRAHASVYRRAALTAIAEVYDQLLLPYQEFHVYDDLQQQGALPYGQPLQAVARHLQWLEHSAPVNYVTLEDLEQLSDSTRYVIGGQAATRLAGAWLRFGNEARARQMLALARDTGFQPSAGDSQALMPALEVRNGTINGRLYMSGNRVAGVRLALVRLRAQEAQDRKAEVDAPVSGVDIVDSILLSVDGDFSFTNLTGGSYRLVMLVSTEILAPGAAPTAENVPGILVLNGMQPDVDVGTISILDNE